MVFERDRDRDRARVHSRSGYVRLEVMDFASRFGEQRLQHFADAHDAEHARFDRSAVHWIDPFARNHGHVSQPMFRHRLHRRQDGVSWGDAASRANFVDASRSRRHHVPNRRRRVHHASRDRVQVISFGKIPMMASFAADCASSSSVITPERSASERVSIHDDERAGRLMHWRKPSRRFEFPSIQCDFPNASCAPCVESSISSTMAQ